MYRRSLRQGAALPRRSAPVRHSRRPGSVSTAPIVAFLLIASFGILFAGCTRQGIEVRGPTSDDEWKDVTFTQQDIERFRALSTSSASTTGTPVLSADGVKPGSSSSGGPVVLSISNATGAALLDTPMVLDLSLKGEYDSLRTKKAGDQPNMYKVIHSFANVRSGASSKSAQIGTLNSGEEVTLVQFVDSEWAKIKMKDGKEGYVVSKYLARFTTQDKLEAEKKAFGNMYYVSYGFVNVRATPDQKAEKLGQIPGKQFVQPLEIKNGWAKVQFQGKDGYVSMQYLGTFVPQFLAAQNTYTLPVLTFDAGDAQSMMLAVQVAAELRKNGTKLMTLRDFRQILLDQQKREFVFQGKNAVIAVRGITKANALSVSNALNGAGIPATLFIQTKEIGVSGITQKTLLRLLANGFDIQSGAHTGEDLRALTSAQVKLEVEQSRKILEDIVKKPVFAIAYPQGGVNDRVEQISAAAGYLFGIGALPESEFGRDELLRMPSFVVTSSMPLEDIVELVK